MIRKFPHRAQRPMGFLVPAACTLLAAALLTACNSSEVAETSPPQSPFRVHQIYNPGVDAAAEIHQALAEAARQHKRVLLDFGGNWCGDCQILDYYFHQQPDATLIAQDYILVDVDVGQMDRNMNIAAQYDMPLKHGVPALAVLDAQGDVVYSQTEGQFSDMGRVDPGLVTEFLERWKG
jgi:thioredoxin 1